MRCTFHDDNIHIVQLAWRVCYYDQPRYGIMATQVLFVSHLNSISDLTRAHHCLLRPDLVTTEMHRKGRSSPPVIRRTSPSTTSAPAPAHAWAPPTPDWTARSTYTPTTIPDRAARPTAGPAATAAYRTTASGIARAASSANVAWRTTSSAATTGRAPAVSRPAWAAAATIAYASASAAAVTGRTPARGRSPSPGRGSESSTSTIWSAWSRPIVQSRLVPAWLAESLRRGSLCGWRSRKSSAWQYYANIDLCAI